MATLGCATSGSGEQAVPEDGGGADGTLDGMAEGAVPIDGEGVDASGHGDALVPVDSPPDAPGLVDVDAGGNAPDADAGGSDLDADGGASPEAEAGTGDATSDATGDATANDASEASIADAEAGADVSDGGGGIDAAAVIAFAHNVALAKCQNWLSCCPGGAAAYDLNACVTAFGGYGWEGNLPLDQTALARGFVVVDDIKAAQCLTAIQNLPCGAQTAAQWSTVTQACALVLTGTLPADAGGCYAPFDCASGLYCDPTTPAPSGGGTCKPLAGQGQPCNTTVPSYIAPRADYMCSYLGSSNTGLFCDLINNGPDAATCQPLLATGANCVGPTRGDPHYSFYRDDQACPLSAALCGDNGLCGSTASYPYTNLCKPYLLKDAGTD